MELQALIGSMGYVLLEVKTVHISAGRKVYMVIHSEQGISMEDCAFINKTILPRLEILFSSREITLEVSSPGLERELAGFDEFMIFQGKYVRVLLEDSRWIYGVIAKADEKSLFLNKAGIMREIRNDHIRKAQLIYRGEK